MPKPTFVNCAFDPNLCPLLQGLSAEDQQARMQEDPLIRQCIAHLAENGRFPSPCSTLNADAVRTAKSRKRRLTATA